MISSLRDLGKTVFLTTRYMDEAQVLADRAAILVRGRIAARARPTSSAKRAGAGTEIRFRLPAEIAADDLPGDAARAPGRQRVRDDSTGEPVAVLNELTGWALSRGVDLAGLNVGQPKPRGDLPRAH